MTDPRGWERPTTRSTADARLFAAERPAKRPGGLRLGAVALRLGRLTAGVLVILSVAVLAFALTTPDEGPIIGVFPPEGDIALPAVYGGAPVSEAEAEILAETATPRPEYVPFLAFRDGDHTGPHLDVEDGIRRSYQATGADDAEAVDIWFFGGSALFGVGQRDEHTIPSDVAREAEADGLPVRVVNFGQRDWVNWQSALLMAQLLTEQAPPDLAVFYDGFNEVLLAHERGSWVEDRPSEPSHLRAGQGVEVQRDLLALGGTEVPDPEPRERPATLAESAEAVGELYGRGVDLVRRLAARHGFTAVHAWQPSLFSRTAPGPERLDSAAGVDPEPFVELTRLAGSRLPTGVVDLSDGLDGLSEPVFLDPAHTNEAGARIMGRLLYRELSAAIRAAAGP